MRERESRGQRPTSVCVAIATILALLVAPFCAPGCSATACAWSSAGGKAQASDCHHEALGDDAAAANSLISVAERPISCNPPELQPATLSAAKSGIGLLQMTESTTYFLSGAFGQSQPSLLRAKPAFWLQSNTSSGKSDT